MLLIVKIKKSTIKDCVGGYTYFDYKTTAACGDVDHFGICLLVDSDSCLEVD